MHRDQSSPAEFEIFPPHEAFYIISLLSCTESALASANSLSDLIKEYSKSPEFSPPQPILNHLQNIAIQGAAISRFFWPPRKEYKKRGEFLRSRFGLNDSNPLRSRELRNRMEHYDECLDDYFSEQLVGTFIPDYVGYEPREEEVPYHLFRAYFIDTGKVEILGVRFELQPLMDEIAKLHDVLEHCDKNGSRFPPQ